MMDKSHALTSLRPGAQWILRGDNDLEWLSEDIVQPTEEELQEEIKRLQAEYDSKEYKRKRKPEYPAIEDQLDLLYHEGIEGWKKIIKDVKDKYPKPEAPSE